MAESQASTALDERFFDDPSQLSQLLRQRAGSDKARQFTTSTDSHPSGGAASIATFAIPPLLHAIDGSRLPVVPSPRRRVAPAGHGGHAKLSTHHSAPTESGFVKESDGVAKMHHSFSGMHAPGDTQPDSQIYRQWTSGVFSADEPPLLSKTTSPKSLFTEHIDEDDGDSPSDSADFVESSQEQHSLRVTSPTIMYDDDVLGPPAHSIYAPTSPLKFETPAVAGRKRDSSGHMLSSAVRTNTTPGTVESVAAFPGFGAGGIAPMSLTQVWNNTQAPTSPVVHDASEDLAFTRPSPNFTHARQSSPAPAPSSPIKATQQDDNTRSDPILRSSSEPRAEYVSMKESQERRRRTSGERAPRLLEEDSWEQPSAAQSRMQKKKDKGQADRTTAKSFAHIPAPRLLSPGAGKKRSATVSVFSPTKRNSARNETGLQNDGAGERVEGASTTNAQLGEDSPGRLSQDVLFTARSYNSKDNSVQVPKTSSHPTRTQSDRPPRNSSRPPSPASQLTRRSQLQATASQPNLTGSLRPHSSRESVAIMDSQPDMTANDSIPRPKSIRYPSSPSVNQYSINQTTMVTKTGYTSQVMSSSVPPMPPISSQVEAEVDQEEEVIAEGAGRVPSSPPITATEDDIEYDEHVYDEYAAEAGVRDSVEPEVTNDDGSNDGDDLPTAKSEPDNDDADAKVGVEQDDELDLVQPRIVDLGTDQEVPETLEQDAPFDANFEEPGPMRPPGSEHDEAFGHAHEHSVRIQRQDTIPETDALEETQPSLFPEDDSTTHNNQNSGLEHDESTDAPNDTNSNEPFHTAREQLSGSRENKPSTSSRDHESDTLQTTERILTLQDIQNMPDTQQTSTDEFQMPRLSGMDEDEDLMAIASPAVTPAKRRKVTYTTRHNANRSPRKPADTFQPRRESSPSVQKDDSPTASAQEREVQSAASASNTREEAEGLNLRRATLKSRPMPRPSRGQAKSGSLKAVSREVIADLSTPADSPSKLRLPNGHRKSSPVTPTKLGKRTRRGDDNVEMPNVVDERDELADAMPEPLQSSTDSGEQLTGDIIVPNRVFASWPGSHFYPARCIGRVTGQQLRIRFDDDNDTKLDATQVRALDLHPGDQVKVDETGRKKHTYIVVGFKDKIEDPDAPDLPTTDRHGYATVVLEEKRRDSLPVAKAAKPVEHITAPMSSIYITTQLWTRLRGRAFNFSPPTSPSKSTSRIGTPLQNDHLATTSFSRRGTTAPSLLKGATARAASVTSSSTRSSSGVFANMAFVLTSTGTNVDKDEISRSIKTNGGTVLEQGFHELFDPESSDAPTSSQMRRRSDTEVEGHAGLTLKSAYKDLGFVALISDSHSRSTKYIQALALNVPCLHLRWVQDSLQASRAAPFLKYLLPAGVSKFLDPNGVVRSRTMTAYDPAAEDLTFDQTVNDRDLLLRNQTVLLVTGKSKKEIEKRQPFVFLTHALGSAQIGRCTDLNAASDLLHDGQWDWVYVDNGETGVADAAAELFGTGKPAASGKSKKGKKRRRDDTEEKEELVARGEVNGKKVKITCSEFVIQSLILGALVEE